MKMASCQALSQQEVALSTHGFSNTTHIASGNPFTEQSFKAQLNCFDARSASHSPHSRQELQPTSHLLTTSASKATQDNGSPTDVIFLVGNPDGRTAQASTCPTVSYDCFVKTLLESAAGRNTHARCNKVSLPSSFTQKRSHEEESQQHLPQGYQSEDAERRVRRRVEDFKTEQVYSCQRSQRAAESASRAAFIMHKGRILDRKSYRALLLSSSSRNGKTDLDVSIRHRLRGG